MASELSPESSPLDSVYLRLGVFLEDLPLLDLFFCPHSEEDSESEFAGDSGEKFARFAHNSPIPSNAEFRNNFKKNPDNDNHMRQ